MRAAMLISNTTKVSNVIQKMNYKFSLIRSKRSFNHWYIGAGMEEGELDEA
jgi:tubulin alpha